MGFRMLHPGGDVSERPVAIPEGFVYGSRPPVPLRPFFQPAYYQATRRRKTGPRDHLCHFLNFGYMDEEKGRDVYSRHLSWHHSDAPWITPVRAAPTEAPRYIYVAVPKPVPVFASSPTLSTPPPAPAPAPLHQTPVAAPAPAPSTTGTTTRVPPGPSEAPVATTPAESKSPARELEYDGDQEMLGGHDAKPVLCLTLHGNCAIDMVYFRPWIIRLRCLSWLPVIQLMRPSVCTVPRKIRRTYRLLLLPTSPHLTQISDVNKVPEANVWQYSVDKEFGGVATSRKRNRFESGLLYGKLKSMVG